MQNITNFITSRTNIQPTEQFVAETRSRALVAFSQAQEPQSISAVTFLSRFLKVPEWLKISLPIAAAFAALLVLRSSLVAPTQQSSQLHAIEEDVVSFGDELAQDIEQDEEFDSFLAALETGDVDQLNYYTQPTGTN